MRKKLFGVISIVAIPVMLAAGSAYGNTPAGTSVRVHIPFEFGLGDETLPAGAYRIARLVNHNARVIQRLDGDSTIVLLRCVTSRPAAEDVKLIFERHGDRYTLTDIWPGANHAAWKLAGSEE